MVGSPCLRAPWRVQPAGLRHLHELRALPDVPRRDLLGATAARLLREFAGRGVVACVYRNRRTASCVRSVKGGDARVSSLRFFNISALSGQRDGFATR